MDEIEINSVGYERGLQYILDNPWNALMLDLKKSVLMFAAPQRLPSELLQHDRPIWQEYSFSIVINASFVVLESIGILWILSNRKKLDLSGRLLITCAALSYIVQIAFFVDARYAMPIVFVFSIFGAQLVISSAYEKTPQHASDRLPL